MARKCSKLVLVFLLSAFVLAIAVNGQDPSFDVVRYEAHIEPEMTTQSISGKVLVKFISLKDDASEIQLNAGDLEIDAVRENRKALKFVKQKGYLNISLRAPGKTS